MVTSPFYSLYNNTLIAIEEQKNCLVHFELVLICRCDGCFFPGGYPLLGSYSVPKDLFTSYKTHRSDIVCTLLLFNELFFVPAQALFWGKKDYERVMKNFLLIWGAGNESH